MKLSDEIQKIINGASANNLLHSLDQEHYNDKNNKQLNPLINANEQKLIKEGFRRLKSKTDLLNLLNYTKKLMYGEKYSPIHLKSLQYYANPQFCKTRYTQFTIPKKSGKERTINAPVKGLKSILRVLNTVLQCIHEPNVHAVGFVPGKSIVDGAKRHTKKNYVYNIDLSDFFHSFDRNRVKSGFLQPPFNMRSQEKEPIAFLLSCLCTHPFLVDGELKIVLPQGSPTSPTITNILCERLDRRLNGLAKRFTCTYSRYADDITFSCQKNVFKEDEFKDELNKIISEQKLKIQPAKTRLLINRGSRRQEVTGLVVNDKANVKRKYVKEARMWLYYWEKYGFEKANALFQSRYVPKYENVEKKKKSIDFIKVLTGKIEFINMVQGNKSSVGTKLKDRLTALQTPHEPLQTNKEPALESWKYAKKIAMAIEEINFETENSSKEFTQIDTLLNSWKDANRFDIMSKCKSQLNTQLESKKSLQGYINKVDLYERDFHGEADYSWKKEKHEPRDLVELLKNFGRDKEGIVKYISHLWDGDGFKKYTDFTKKLQERNIQEEVFKQIQNLNFNLWMKKIHPFVFQKEKVKDISFEWGRYNIKIGWQYPSNLKEWCKINFDNKKEGKQPFAMRIPKELKPDQLINFKSITTFQDVAELFINEIRFSEGYFYDMIQDLIIDKLEEMNVDDSQLESIKEFTAYTNTEFVLNAIEIILEMIQKNAKESCREIVIKSSLIANENKFVIEILHLNAVCSFPHSHAKLSGNEGKLSVVREKLFGLCDFSIKGRFTDNNKHVFSEINYLSQGDFRRQDTITKNKYSGYNKATINKIEDPGGFGYYLTFYI